MPEMAGLLEREFGHYLNEHRHPGNRLLHFVGIPLLVVTAVVALIRLDPTWFVVGQVVGWSLQFVGHRIEGNRPVIFRRPIALLMGPLMVLIELLRLVGLRFRFAESARRSVAAQG